MKIYLDTVGCRLNQAEIEQYAQQLRSVGHTLAASPSEADVAVVNTCAVTAAAASDPRQKIRQMARAGVAQVLVTGCWSTLLPEEAVRLATVSRVVPNADKDHLVLDWLHLHPDLLGKQPGVRRLIPGARRRTRAFIKVQDGCDNLCTFCVSRIARGPSRSRPVEEVLADVLATLGEGGRHVSGFEQGAAAQEVVLTGVQLGSWGRDFSPPQHLGGLIQAILEATAVPRLRLSSLEPWDLEQEFFALWQNPRLCRHLHLPLQSGCAATLRRMGRKTTPDAYAALVAEAREMIPGVAITTDLIAGFPGESLAEFEESLNFVRAMQFADGHVFTFCARPGTPAERLPQRVPVGLARERNAALRRLLDESAAAYRSAFLGQTLPVLWESGHALEEAGWEWSGLTGNYLRVKIHSSEEKLWNRIVPVCLIRLDGDAIEGQLVAGD